MLKHTITAAVVAGTVLAGSHAHAQTVTDCGSSFMILPDGNCMSLEYLSILGQSRMGLNQANQSYARLYNANLRLSVANSQLPVWLRETQEEKDARIETLVDVGQQRDDIAASNETVETILWPLHIQAMDIVGNTYRSNRATYRP